MKSPRYKTCDFYIKETGGFHFCSHPDVNGQDGTMFDGNKYIPRTQFITGPSWCPLQKEEKDA